MKPLDYISVSLILRFYFVVKATHDPFLEEITKKTPQKVEELHSSVTNGAMNNTYYEVLHSTVSFLGCSKHRSNCTA